MSYRRRRRARRTRSTAGPSPRPCGPLPPGPLVVDLRLAGVGAVLRRVKPGTDGLVPHLVGQRPLEAPRRRLTLHLLHRRLRASHGAGYAPLAYPQGREPEDLPVPDHVFPSLGRRGDPVRPTGSIMVGDACSGGRRSLELRSVGDGMPVARACCTHLACYHALGAHLGRGLHTHFCGRGPRISGDRHSRERPCGGRSFLVRLVSSVLGTGFKGISSVPVGFIERIIMRLMDFEEYCWAIGVSRSSWG